MVTSELKNLIKRRKTRSVRVGDKMLGSDYPILVQSMTKTETKNVKATVKQIHQLEKAGCELVRVAVPDEESAKKLSTIKKEITIPLIADIHFDYRLALEAINQGVDKIRLNPGNIRDKKKIEQIVLLAKDKGIPIRIGVNSGSLSRDLLAKYKGATAEALVESALWEIDLFEKLHFYDIVISLKSSDTVTTVLAYQLLAKKVDYPFHLGITEAGSLLSGSIKSAIGIGSLLMQGIGDTIRVSLTADPVEEVKVGWHILQSLNLRSRGINFISCPMCGRCKIERFQQIVSQIEKKLKNIDKQVTVAIMGCEVNGPGEAKHADIGLACGKGSGLLFKYGKPIKKIKEAEFVSALVNAVKEL